MQWRQCCYMRTDGRTVRHGEANSRLCNFANTTKRDVHESVHRDMIMKVTNKMQLYRLIYYS